MIGNRPLSTGCIAFAFALAVVAAAPRAGAQGFDVQQLHPGPSQRTNAFDVSQARILGDGAWEFGLFVHVADAPLLFEPPEEDRLDYIVASQLTADLTGAIGLGGVVELGVGIPLVLLQNGDESEEIGDADAPNPGFGLGDLRFVPTANFFDGDTEDSPGGTALSFAVPVYFPTGNDDDYRSDGALRLEPKLLFDGVLPGGTRLTANAGYQVRPRTRIVNLVVDDALTWGAAVDIPIGAARAVHALAELTGDIAVRAEGLSDEDLPMEAIAGARYIHDNGLMMQLGGGLGILPGLGTPNWRGFVAISYGNAGSSDRDDDDRRGRALDRRIELHTGEQDTICG